MRGRIATIIRQRGARLVVLVNCQLEGGADEGQPGLVWSLLKRFCSTNGSNR